MQAVGLRAFDGGMARQVGELVMPTSFEAGIKVTVIRSSGPNGYSLFRPKSPTSTRPLPLKFYFYLIGRRSGKKTGQDVCTAAI